MIYIFWYDYNNYYTDRQEAEPDFINITLLLRGTLTLGFFTKRCSEVSEF